MRRLHCAASLLLNSFKVLAKEPLIAILPADHPLTSHRKMRPQDLASQIYVSSSKTSPDPEEHFEFPSIAAHSHR